MRYDVQIDARVAKALRRIPPKDAERIMDAIDRLGDDPRPPGVKKLTGRPGWRIRVGDYRILYEIDGDLLRVYVFKAGPRGHVYE